MDESDFDMVEGIIEVENNQHPNVNIQNDVRWDVYSKTWDNVRNSINKVVYGVSDIRHEVCILNSYIMVEKQIDINEVHAMYPKLWDKLIIFDGKHIDY